HARDQPFYLLAQPRLREADDDRLLLQLVGRVVLAIALDVERRGDDLALVVGERVHLVHLAAATTAAAGHRLRRAEVLLERANAHEIDVARLAGTALAAVVRGPGVIRDGVAGVDAELLEIERVPRGDVRETALAGEQLDRLF